MAQRAAVGVIFGVSGARGDGARGAGARGGGTRGGGDVGVPQVRPAEAMLIVPGV